MGKKSNRKINLLVEVKDYKKLSEEIKSVNKMASESNSLFEKNNKLLDEMNRKSTGAGDGGIPNEEMIIAGLEFTDEMVNRTIKLNKEHEKYVSNIDSSVFHSAELLNVNDDLVRKKKELEEVGKLIAGTLTQQAFAQNRLKSSQEDELNAIKNISAIKKKDLEDSKQITFNWKSLMFGASGLIADQILQYKERQKIGKAITKLDADTKKILTTAEAKHNEEIANEKIRAYLAYQAQRRKIEQQIAEHSKQTAELEWQNNMDIAQSMKSKAESIAEVEGAYATELNLIEGKNKEALEAEEKKYDALIKKAKQYHLNTKQLQEDKLNRLRELNEHFDMIQEKREEEKQNRIQAINDEAERKEQERIARKKEADQKQMDEMKSLIDIQKSIYDQYYSAINETAKDVREKNEHGLIDVDATRTNLEIVKRHLQEYQSLIQKNHKEKMLYYEIEMIGMDKNSSQYLALLRDKTQAQLDFESKDKDVNKQLQDNAKQTADLQKQYWEEVGAKMQEYSAVLSEGMGSVMSGMKAIMQDGLDDAKEKLSEVSELHSKVVDERKESDARLQELEEQAKNARGGRGAALQAQIDAEMAKNKQLADQEKNLAKEKEKQEKEVAKKEKQMKKAELAQNIVMGISNTAMAVVKAWGTGGPILGPILAALAGAAGAVQVAVMSKQLAKMEDGGLLRGRRHAQGGMRIEGTNIEVEGGEYVVNRESTRKNVELLGYINKQRKEFVDGTTI